MMRIDTRSDDAFISALKRTAAFWGYDLQREADMAHLPVLTTERLVDRMKKEAITPDRRYAPSSFSLEDPLALVPAYRRDVWPQLQRVIEATAAHALITFLPAILQLDIPVFTTLQSRTLPGVSVASNNTAVAIEALRQLNADGVVATSASAAVLESALAQPAAPEIQYWYIVTPASAALYRSRIALAYHDLHALPGVSIASQCTELAKSGDDAFHPSPDFVWESINDELVVSSIDDRPAPLLRMPACRGAILQKPCSCGARVLLTRHA